VPPSILVLFLNDARASQLLTPGEFLCMHIMKINSCRDAHLTPYEDEFARLVMGHSQKVVEIDRQAKQRELNALNARDREIDNLFNRMYEDNASGKIDDTRFSKMSRQYADEQTAIAEAMKSIKAELEKKTDKAMTTGAFIAMVCKYTRAKKLTQRMLNELIEKIEVHHADKSSGEHRHFVHHIGIR
jgi:hypothetical protein